MIADYILRTQIHTHTMITRILELTSLVYFGGLEAHVHHNNILSTTYDGCIADVELGGRLLDFGQPEREEGTKIGCPPLEALCSQICPRNQECVQLWGGTVCNCEGDGCVGGELSRLHTIVINSYCCQIPFVFRA